MNHPHQAVSNPQPLPGTPQETASTVTAADSSSFDNLAQCSRNHQTLPSLCPEPCSNPSLPAASRSSPVCRMNAASLQKNETSLLSESGPSLVENNAPGLEASHSSDSDSSLHHCQCTQTSFQRLQHARTYSLSEELGEANKCKNVERTLKNDSQRYTSMSLSESLTSTLMNDCQAETAIADLPVELLMNIFQRLPTVSLIACATACSDFADLISDTQFLNIHTRHVLGFADNQTDITYDMIPVPVAMLQNIWFEEYLYRAAPYIVGLVKPGVIFYDLLCFKHLFDTWLLQGFGYKYRLFIADVLQTSHTPPLSFLQCKRLITIHKSMMLVLMKMALCQPEILLLTVNDFEELSICSGLPSDLDDVWEQAIPSQWRQLSEPQETCEVVSRQRGLALASFFITCSAHRVVCWCGIIDYSTFRWKDTWGAASFSTNAPLSDMGEIYQEIFHRFKVYLGNEYISVHCANAFLFRGICKLIQQRQLLLPLMQGLLEKTAAGINRKLQKALSPEECREIRSFLDRVQFVFTEESSSKSPGKAPHRETSKTLEVAVQRYLHRYLNKVIGQQVLQLYQDPTCHHILCLTCRNTNSIRPTFFCPSSDRVGPQRIPLKIWPPHLMRCGMLALPALAKFVRLDIELWKRDLLDKRLSDRVEDFVRQVLKAVYLDISLYPSRSGIIARRFLLQ